MAFAWAFVVAADSYTIRELEECTTLALSQMHFQFHTMFLDVVCQKLFCSGRK
jgi:hypothetical protein